MYGSFFCEFVDEGFNVMFENVMKVKKVSHPDFVEVRSTVNEEKHIKPWDGKTFCGDHKGLPNLSVNVTPEMIVKDNDSQWCRTCLERFADEYAAKI